MMQHDSLDHHLRTAIEILQQQSLPDAAEQAIAALRRAMEIQPERPAPAIFSELLIHSSMDGILAFDSQCRYTVWNPAMERMSGMQASQVLGRIAFEVFPFLRKTREDRAFLATLAGTWLQRTDRPYRVPETGREGFYEAHYSPLREQSGEIVGGLAIIRDITERKEADRRLLQSERLSAVGQMIAGMAHESRNALQRSQACLDVLSLKVQDRPEVHDLIDRIQSAQDHLHRLYEEVRNYAAPIRLQLDDSDVREVMRAAWEALTAARQGRDAELAETGDCDCRCNIDSQLIQKVFYNVLDNSLSLTPDPVKITVHWSAESRDGTSCITAVLHDNGPGLTAEQQARIFEPFYTTKTRGTGLGMPIARRLVEAHGGKMTVGLGPSEGAEIRITLPRRY